MPVHFDSLTETKYSELFAWILQEALENCNDAFAQSNGKYFLGSAPFIDQKTGKEIGKFVFTFFSNIEQQRNEILDVDIVLNNDMSTEITFSKKLPQSSDSNEYYEAITAESGQHLIVETVNRYVEEREIEGETLSIYASAFPYGLTVFKNEKEFNKFFGFEKAINVADTGLRVHGLGTDFIMPGGILKDNDKTEKTPWSFVVGTVEDFSKVTIAFGENQYNAYIIQLHTALGTIPVLAGTEMFNMKKLSKGRIVGMNAYIKANFVRNQYPKKQK